MNRKSRECAPQLLWPARNIILDLSKEGGGGILLGVKKDEVGDGYF